MHPALTGQALKTQPLGTRSVAQPQQPAAVVQHMRMQHAKTVDTNTSIASLLQITTSIQAQLQSHSCIVCRTCNPNPGQAL